MGDAGELLMGRFGRELFGIGQLLFLIFLMASHILTFTVVFNTITNHGTCTIVFGVVGLVVSFIGALPRTMGKVYWMSMACTYPPGLLMAIRLTMYSMHQYCNGYRGNHDRDRSASPRSRPRGCDHRGFFPGCLPCRDQHHLRLQYASDFCPFLSSD
jgi:hypothetical protein